MKEKIDFKLINLLIICLILFIFFIVKDYLLDTINFVFKMFKPFIISFIIAYFIYPLTIFFKKRFNQKLSVFFTISSVLLIFSLVLFFIGPIIYKESINLIFIIIKLLKSISFKYSIDLNNYLDMLIDLFFKAPFDIFNLSFLFLSNFIIILILSIYLLIYMDKIRNFIKLVFKNYKILKNIDVKINSYFATLFYITIITFFEYLIAYLFIGHDEALLLAFLASLLNMIPFFGGIICGVIAILLSIEVSKVLVIKTIIVVILCSFLDSYVINPIMFKKSNDINPILSIFSMIVLGKMFGALGIILSIPFVIILKEVFYYIYK